MDIAMVASAALAGLLSFFSPCVLPLIPVYLGMLAANADGGRVRRFGRAANTVAFVLGVSFVFVALGAGAGALGSLANNAYLTVALGILVFVLGLHLAGALDVPMLRRQLSADVSARLGHGVPSSFLLGLAFSFGWTPCVGPILGTILALAAEQDGALAGAALLFVYALGLCVPFLALSLASDLVLAKVKKINRFLPAVQRIGGALIAVMGLWMVFSQVNALVNSQRAMQEEAGQAQVAAEQASDPVQASAGGPSEVNLTEVHAGQADVSGVSSAWKNVVLTDLDGEKHRLSDYAGKPVYFEFWGSWCSSCVQDLGQLTEVWREHEEKGDVTVVSVVVPGFYGERDADDFVAWARQEGVELPVLMDTRSSLATYLGVAGFPTSVFVSSDGSLSKIRVGAIERDELEELIGELD